MLKKKTFIFEELNYFFLLIAIFQKIIGRKVYFHKLIKSWQNEKSINFFKSIGLIWLNLQNLEVSKIKENWSEAVDLQKEFGSFLDDLDIYKFLNKKLVSLGCNPNDLKCFVLAKELTRFRHFCDIYKSLDILQDNNENDFVIVVNSPDFFSKVLKKKFKNKADLLNFHYFYYTLLFFKIIFKKIKIKKKQTISNDEKINFSGEKNIREFKTLFFPHQGVYYGSMYKKDYFYSTNPKSHFYHSNILHLSNGDYDLNDAKTNEFYKENKITNIDFKSLGKISFKEIIFEAWNFISKNYFFSNNTFQSIFFFLHLWLLIKRSLNQLNALPNAKVVFFGYDLLCPIEISIACRIKNIKTIATQERFIAAWQGFYFFVLDHYFVINDEVRNFILINGIGTIKNITTIGPVRSDLINAQNVNEDHNKKIVMVSDMNSNLSTYDNGLRFIANWKHNYIFYDNILKLSQKNPDINFVIKGKNYNFMNIPYFNNIKKIIEKSPNVKLYEEKNNSAYDLIDKVALTISAPGSLIDEILFKKKSIIILETVDGYPSNLFTYGKNLKNLIVKNYNDLEEKFNLWKQDPKKFNENTNVVANNFFPHNRLTKTVKEILHQHLEDHYNF